MQKQPLKSEKIYLSLSHKNNHLDQDHDKDITFTEKTNANTEKTDTNMDTNTNTNPGTNPDTNTNTNQETNSDTNTDKNPDRNTDTNTDTYDRGCKNYAAAPISSSSAVELL